MKMEATEQMVSFQQWQELVKETADSALSKKANSARKKKESKTDNTKGFVRIAMLGDTHYDKRNQIKDLMFKLKKKFDGKVVIVSRGNDGIEQWIKKFAIEFGLYYVEYNAAHTEQNLYSGMDESFYGKPYHYTNVLRQYDYVIWNSDKLVYFGLPETKKESDYLRNSLKKSGKKIDFISA